MTSPCTVAEEAKCRCSLQEVFERVERDLPTRVEVEEEIHVIVANFATEAKEVLAMRPTQHVRILEGFDGRLLVGQSGRTDGESVRYRNRRHPAEARGSST